VGAQPVDGVEHYCHEIETYLCRKNDGHLIRVVGPSFDLVSGWAARGVPLKVAFAGIDRSVERYYRKGPRRRPVKIDFCEADVLDVFDEWQRATGIRNPHSTIRNSEPRHSLPSALERALMRLTTARATGAVGPEFDGPIDRVAAALDEARAAPGGLRGEARKSLIARLAAIDADLLTAARAALEEGQLAALTREAEADLAPFRGGMTPEAWARARAGAVDRLVRQRLALPVVAFV